MAAGQSPASSPRLPSPPPMAEDQLGPVSPGISLFEDHGQLPGANTVDTGAARRIRPGTKAEDMAEGPPLVELHDIDSAFPLTEHLKALHYSHTCPAGSNTTSPITAEVAKQLAVPPPNTGRDIWLYELARFLIQKTNAIIVGLFADSPACSAQTCPEMRASEWQYLCSVHDPPKNCSAIDYCCHTLDWAATSLTSSKMFPSRLGLGSGAGGFAAGGPDKVLQQQMKELTNIFRRVYRIYAHAWFQHREMFWRVEAKTGLYVFFKTVCDVHGLIPPENYTIPPEAEGLEAVGGHGGTQDDTLVTMPILLKRDPSDVSMPVTLNEVADDKIIAGGETTKRHRHTMSDHVNSVTTIIQEEEVEDEDEGGSAAITANAQPLRSPLERRTTTLPIESHSTPDESEPTDDTVVHDEHPTVDPDPPLLDTSTVDAPEIGIVRSDTLKPEPAVQDVAEDIEATPTIPEPTVSEQTDASTEDKSSAETTTATTVEDIGEVEST